MLILDYFGVRYDSPTFRHLVMTRDARKGKYRSYTDDDYDKKSFHIFNSFSAKLKDNHQAHNTRMDNYCAVVDESHFFLMIIASSKPTHSSVSVT